MTHIWYSIISLHWRKKHVLGLIIITLLGLLSQFFLKSISLWEWQYISNEMSFATIEIVWLIFVLYFWSTTISNLIKDKILYLLRAKKEDSHSIIWWILLWIISIILLYITLAFMMAYIIWWNTLINFNFISLIGLFLILSITTLIVILFSLLSNAYIAFMSGLIIYGISYSINFIIESAKTQAINSFNISILNIIKYIFPRFDLLSTNILNTWTQIRVFIGHIIYIIALYFIIVKVFSSRYTNHENLLKFWHNSQRKEIRKLL